MASTDDRRGASKLLRLRLGGLGWPTPGGSAALAVVLFVVMSSCSVWSRLSVLPRLRGYRVAPAWSPTCPAQVGVVNVRTGPEAARCGPAGGPALRRAPVQGGA
jgi:hypothetical protein